jgi:hypothetical protein
LRACGVTGYLSITRRIAGASVSRAFANWLRWVEEGRSMKSTGLAGVLAASLALAGSIDSLASAQEQTPRPAAQPPSPEAVAKAREYGDALIAAANVGDLFENVTTADHAVLRHRQSGLECNFNGTPGERITVFPSQFPRGDDVGCAIQWLGFTTSLDITRFPTLMTTDEATTKYVGEVTRAHPEAKPYTGKGVSLQTRDGKPLPCRTVKFVLNMNGKTVFSRLSVAVVNGWVIEERVSGPLDNPTLGDLLGETGMMMAIDSVKK